MKSISTLGLQILLGHQLLAPTTQQVAGTASATGGAVFRYSKHYLDFRWNSTYWILVSASDSDNDDYHVSQVVTITAGFSKTMTPTTTIGMYRTVVAHHVMMGLVTYRVTVSVVLAVKVANSGGNKYFIEQQRQLSPSYLFQIL